MVGSFTISYLSLQTPECMEPKSTKSTQVDRTFALIQRLSEPLDEALCSQAVEAAIRTQRPQLANSFMETCLGEVEEGDGGDRVVIRCKRWGNWGGGREFDDVC